MIQNKIPLLVMLGILGAILCGVIYYQPKKLPNITMKKNEIDVLGGIVSTPAVILNKKESGAWVAFVHAEPLISIGLRGRETKYFIGVNAFQDNGKHLSFSPLLHSDGESAPYLVMPGQQVASNSVGEPKELFLVDIDGRLRVYGESGQERLTGETSPGRGHLLWFPEPTTDGAGKQTGWIFLSTEYRTYTIPGNSQNQIDVTDLKGTSLPGFPVALAGVAERHPPVFDYEHQRVFVLMRTLGEVDGFDIRTGQRLAHFPIKLPPSKDEHTTNLAMVYFSPKNSLIISAGDNQLRSLNIDSGLVTEVPIAGASKISMLAVNKDHLAILDNEKKTVTILDGNMTMLSTLSLSSRDPYHEGYFMRWVKKDEADSGRLIILWHRKADPVSEIERLYEKYKKPDWDYTIETFYKDYAKSEYGTDDLTTLPPEDLRDMQSMIFDSKQGYVENEIGTDGRMREMDMHKEIILDVVRVADSGLLLKYTDLAPGLSPETESSNAPVVYPGIGIDVAHDMLYTAVPGNMESQNEEGDPVFKAKLIVYSIPLK